MWWCSMNKPYPKQSNKEYLINIRNLSKGYLVEGVIAPILKSISLQVSKGELLAIIGASGSGKSTLMNIIGLLDNYDAGEYWLNQTNTACLNADTLANLRNQYIGFVFQQFNLLSRFTIEYNVGLPLIYRGLSDAVIKTRVLEALAQVHMENYCSYYPTQLSGGQQQRIAIARALVIDASVILADEPTGALDSHTGQDIMRLFLSLHAEGRTIILITHDKKIAMQCPRRIGLADGQIISDTL